VKALEEEVEWRLCATDPTYFFRNYYYIPVVGKGPTLFDLYDYQQQIFETLRDRDMIISLKARQIGMTTVAVAYAMWQAIFHQDSPWLFVSRNEGAATKMLNRGMYAYNRLPPWMRQRIGVPKNLTQTYLVLPNGSSIESVPATASTGRGDSVFGAILDEVAFMDYAESIWGAVEPLIYGKVLLVSTANGMGNFFHETWLDSQEPGSPWAGIFYPWNMRETRDAAWYDQKKLSYRGREWQFYQEYPSNPEEAFAKSGRVAFPYDIMVEQPLIEPVMRLEYLLDGSLDEVELGADVDVAVDVWVKPEIWRDEYGAVVQKPNYVIGVDVAEGLENGDFSYVTVFDANTGEQCASSKSHIPVEYLSGLVEELGWYYHTALIIVERNNSGLVPLSQLQESGYPRLYRHKDIAARSRTRRKQYGWHTNRSSKPKMVHDFLLALKDNDVVLHDYSFMLESQVFVADGRGSFAATSHNHDDVIMGTLVAWQGVLDHGRFPIVWQDRNFGPVTMEEFFAAGEASSPQRGLDVLLGRPQLDKTKVSVVLHRANVGKSGR
jgi:hypothetical protein